MQLQFYLEEDAERKERKDWKRVVGICQGFKWPKKSKDDLLKRWKFRCNLKSNRSLEILPGIQCGFGSNETGKRIIFTEPDQIIEWYGSCQRISSGNELRLIIYDGILHKNDRSYDIDEIYTYKDFLRDEEINYREKVLLGYRWQWEELVDLRDAMISLLCNILHTTKIKGRIIEMPIIMQPTGF